MIGKSYTSRQTGDTGTVLDVKLQPRELLFLKDRQYRKQYHVLLDMPGNTHAATSGYPLVLFNKFFKPT